MHNSNHSFLSPHTQAMLEKTCAYYGLEDNQKLFNEDDKLFSKDNSLFSNEQEKVNIGSGEDVVLAIS